MTVHTEVFNQAEHEQGSFQNRLRQSFLNLIDLVQSRYDNNRKNYPMGGRQDSTVFFDTLRSSLEDGNFSLAAFRKAFVALKSHLKENLPGYNPAMAASLDLIVGFLVIAVPTDNKEKPKLTRVIFETMVDKMNILFGAFEHTDEDGTVRVDYDQHGGVTNVSYQPPSKDSKEKPKK
jgi:hypothetical protein